MIENNEINTIIFLSIIISSITYFGIIFIYKKIPWIIGECIYNKKSSVFHGKILRGFGIIYPVSIIPILFLVIKLLRFLIISFF